MIVGICVRKCAGNDGWLYKGVSLAVLVEVFVLYRVCVKYYRVCVKDYRVCVKYYHVYESKSCHV